MRLPARDENLSSGDKRRCTVLQHAIVSEIIRADALRGFRELVSEFGGDGDALLREAGIDPAALIDGNAYISLRGMMGLLERAARKLHCQDFGLRMARKSGMDTMGPLSVAMSSAETPRQAVLLAQRYMHFHNPSVFITISAETEDADFVGVELRMSRQPRGIQFVERNIMIAHNVFGLLCGAAYRPRQVRLTHAANAPIAAYREAFGETPQFNAGRVGILLASALLDTPQPARNAEVRRLAEHYLTNVAPPQPEMVAIAPRARLVIAQLMRSGLATQSGVAEALGLHERTLQRRLKGEETSFEALRDEARRDLAHAYLAQPDVPFAHIAEMLGYAEASAFTRASRRWFGETPREMRKRLTSAT